MTTVFTYWNRTNLRRVEVPPPGHWTVTGSHLEVTTEGRVTIVHHLVRPNPRRPDPYTRV